MTLLGSPSRNQADAEPSPAFTEVAVAITPELAFRRLASRKHVVFFDSAMRHPTLGRYSYLAADPIAWRTVPADGQSAITPWLADLSRFASGRIHELPPWQGGAAGVIGYEIGRSIESLPRPRWDEFEFPALAVGIYDTVLAFDHQTGKAWALSHGFTPDGRRRPDLAEQRVDLLCQSLANDTCQLAETPVEPTQLLAPTHETPYGHGVLSNFSRAGYLAAVETVREHLRRGEAYQVNLSQRLLSPDYGDPIALYLRLRAKNPAPFAGYLNGGDWQIASASPERFLQLESNTIETRPIKGTRPLGIREGQELKESEKDQAENVMIVDLLRNDLSRVCQDRSIEVDTLFGLEQYAHVQHLVSVVRGRLRAECGVADLLHATLPGGSITGAPKIAAQEIIARLEPTARGAYCGSMIQVGFPDSGGHQFLDSNVLIRTLTRSKGWVQAPVGGGVVVGSDPVAEYEETWHKAAGLIDSTIG